MILIFFVLSPPPLGDRTGGTLEAVSNDIAAIVGGIIAAILFVILVVLIILIVFYVVR